MPVHLLSDVDVVAISIVKQGANRKRIYLRKNAQDEETFNLPAPGRILKANGEWSVFYAVVAEPGWRENAGQGSPGETLEDEWADPDEIRKAAHRFMKNGALVNRMHESLEPYGTVVENFIAQADIKVGDEVIKEGSWVVGIEPSPEGRELIDAGEFTGISIQGVGTRTLTKEKGYEGDAKKCPHCKGAVKSARKTCQNCGHSFVAKSHAGENVTGPVRHLVAHYMKKPHPFRACVRDNTKRFGPERAKRICATLKDMGHGTHNWRGKKIAKTDHIPEEFYKACEENWYASGLSDQDATIALEMALESEDRTLLQKIADKLGIAAHDDEDLDNPQEEDDVALTDEQVAQLEKVSSLESQVTELTKDDGRLARIEQQLGQIAERLSTSEEPSDEDKRQELEQTVEKLSADLEKAQQDLEELAKGSSHQDDDPKDIQKNDPDAELASALFG